MNKMSIIVPIYNVEKYLSRCLDSIIAQSMNDVEVICVEDCSTDNSRMVLKEKKRNLIKVIYNEENVGLGQARNIGLSHAKGKYLWFMDADDYILEGTLKKL